MRIFWHENLKPESHETIKKLNRVILFIQSSVEVVNFKAVKKKLKQNEIF